MPTACCAGGRRGARPRVRASEPRAGEGLRVLVGSLPSLVPRPLLALHTCVHVTGLHSPAHRRFCPGDGEVGLGSRAGSSQPASQPLPTTPQKEAADSRPSGSSRPGPGPCGVCVLPDHMDFPSCTPLSPRGRSAPRFPSFCLVLHPRASRFPWRRSGQLGGGRGRGCGWPGSEDRACGGGVRGWGWPGSPVAGGARASRGSGLSCAVRARVLQAQREGAQRVHGRRHRPLLQPRCPRPPPPPRGRVGAGGSGCSAGGTAPGHSPYSASLPARPGQSGRRAGLGVSL